jgi:hypothetical protein
VAVTTSSNWIFNFALSYFVPPAIENIRWKVYILFGVFCAAMTVHVFFFFPETAGKTLEDVEGMFESGVKPWETKVQYRNIRVVERGGKDKGAEAGVAQQAGTANAGAGVGDLGQGVVGAEIVESGQVGQVGQAVGGDVDEDATNLAIIRSAGL